MLAPYAGTLVVVLFSCGVSGEELGLYGKSGYRSPLRFTACLHAQAISTRHFAREPNKTFGL